MKGCEGWNSSGVERYLSDIYLMFLSREIDIKLCQIYTKIHIYAILYKSCRFKQIIFSKFAFLIGIIDHINTFNPYSPYYVTSTSANGSAVYWSRDFRMYNLTTILDYYCDVFFTFLLHYWSKKLLSTD